MVGGVNACVRRRGWVGGGVATAGSGRDGAARVGSGMVGLGGVCSGWVGPASVCIGKTRTVVVRFAMVGLGKQRQGKDSEREFTW